MTVGRTLDPDAPLGRVLRAHAGTVDGWLRQACAVGAEPGGLRAALAELEPVAAALAQDTPGTAGRDGTPDDDAAAGRAVLAAVRATVDLVARGRWHVHHPQRQAVVEALPVLAPWCRAWPDATVGAVVAGAAVVGRRVALRDWLGRLAAAPPPSAEHDVRPALLVAAWRAGLSRYRDAAVDAAGGLPAPLARAALGLDPGADVAAVLGRHRGDPWWWPGADGGAGVVARVGGFLPFGGPWVGLPRAVPGGPTGWAVVADGERWAVVADVHGAAVVREGAAPPDPPVPDAPWAVRGVDRLPVPWTDRVTGAVQRDLPGGGRVVLVSRAHSYALDVVRVAA